MNHLPSTLSSVLRVEFTKNASRIHDLAASLTNAQFWAKPLPFGNSIGHLVLHLTGNLNYYIGTQIANTGYVRERPREFSDPTPPTEEEALKKFEEAIAMVVDTVQAQSADDWSAEYSGMGVDARNRLEIVMQCVAHMQHHIGQMIYLKYELERQSAK